MPTALEEQALALVHRGWDHLGRRRPIAAWAAWERVIRVDPGNRAAAEALAVLDAAPDLPASARSGRKFRPPDADRRPRWDLALRDGDLADLDAAADAFAKLAEADPEDAPAWFNRGLCLAWLGRNAEAIGALDEALALLAATGNDADFEAAVGAWALAEILRQGGGAEHLADDLDHALAVDGPVAGLDSLIASGRLRQVPPPPGTDLDDARIFEWLDRAPPPSDPEPSVAALPRLLATLVTTPRSTRLSGPDAAGLATAEAELVRAVDFEVLDARRVSTPLPLPLLDAAVWAFRLPGGLDPDARARLGREAVERFYEGRWLQIPRIGLGGRNPLQAARDASNGDAAARAKLAGVVLVREQLGERPRAVGLYQGYPFDRLRRRLGLEPRIPGIVDPDDLAAWGGPELDAADPSALDDVRLAEASLSAEALGDDRRTVRFAEVLLGRDPTRWTRVDLRPLAAALVREALARDEVPLALEHLGRAAGIDLDHRGGRDRDEFAIWQAEIHARAGEPDSAARVYESVLDRSQNAAVALDAAETLLDNGHEPQGLALARRARDLAEAAGDAEALARADHLIDDLE